MNFDYISFDVFDTCITRSVALPTDVFILMASDIAQLAGIACSRLWIESFVWARVRGEALAREHSLAQEVTLYQIWQQVKYILNLPEGDYEAIELSWEYSVSLLVPKARDEIQSARARSAKIMFVSDMYLPSDFVRKLLLKHQIFQQDDFLFVSSDLDATKSTGRLFDLVCQELGVNPSQVLHHGDNRHSDYDKAIQAGLNANFVEWAKLSTIETSLRASSHLCAAHTTRITAAMRSSRMSASQTAGDLCSQFVTPFLQVFVSWVLQSAKADGVERLYFLGRDCQLAWRFAIHDSLNRESIDCRYLHASRRAYYPALINEVSEKDIPWLCQSWERPILLRLLDKLNVSFVQFADVWADSFPEEMVPQSLETKEDWRKFWSVIQQPIICTSIRSKAALRRERLLAYLTQEGLLDGVQCAFVDVGWTYGIQKSAETVLSQAGSLKPLRGYYLGANFEKWEDGITTSLFPPSIPGTFAGPYSGFPNRMANFLEHILGFATHGSLVDFRLEGGQVFPVLDKEHVGLDYEQATSHQDRAITHLLHLIDLKDFPLNEFDARAFLAKLLQETYENPQYSVADGARGIMVSHDANGHGERSMVIPYNWNEFFRGLRNYILRRPWRAERKREWAAGSLACSPRAIQVLAKRLGIITHLSSL